MVVNEWSQKFFCLVLIGRKLSTFSLNFRQLVENSTANTKITSTSCWNDDNLPSRLNSMEFSGFWLEENFRHFRWIFDKLSNFRQVVENSTANTKNNFDNLSKGWQVVKNSTSNTKNNSDNLSKQRKFVDTTKYHQTIIDLIG